MRKQWMGILIAVISVAGFGAAAKGQSLDKIVVKIPYEFVVAGNILPAGNYTVVRVNNGDTRTLLLSSFDNHVSTILVATDVEDSHTGNNEVSFEQVDGQRFLSEVKTYNHVFTIAVTPSEIMEAKVKSHDGMSASGSTAGSK